jgi:Flp pilus assembly protein TadD
MMHPLEVVQIGQALLRQGETRKAALLAARAVEQFPDHGDVWELLGFTRVRHREFAGAVDAFETATLLKPITAAARFHLAIAYAATGRRQLAVFLCRMLVENPSTPDSLLPIVASHLGKWGEFQEALGACHVILQRNPGRHEAHFGIGFYLRRMGVASGIAAAAIAEAHRLSPETPLYRVVLASLWHEMGHLEDAYDLLRDIPASSLRLRRHVVSHGRRVFVGARLGATE